jgi:membrane-associated phospholipid phosphatase
MEEQYIVKCYKFASIPTQHLVAIFGGSWPSGHCSLMSAFIIVGECATPSIVFTTVSRKLFYSLRHWIISFFLSIVKVPFATT